MQLNRHVNDEDLERYSIGSLQEPVLSKLEEHLLLCPECQRRLEEMDAYVEAMRHAAGRLEAEDDSRRRFWSRVSSKLTFRRLAWVMGAAAAALLAVALRVSLNPTQPSPPYALVLETSRGAEAQHAPAGRGLDLSLDITGLQPLPAYRIEIVDRQGTRVAGLRAELAQGRVRTSVTRGLGAGIYFVRLYAPSGELLREYALEVKQSP